MLRPTLLLVSAVLMAAPAHANMMQQIIVGKCSQAMQDDFKKAGKTPPAGMVNDTCGICNTFKGGVTPLIRYASS